MYIKDSSLNPMSELTLTIILHIHVANSLLNPLNPRRDHCATSPYNTNFKADR